MPIEWFLECPFENKNLLSIITRKNFNRFGEEANLTKNFNFWKLTNQGKIFLDFHFNSHTFFGKTIFIYLKQSIKTSFSIIKFHFSIPYWKCQGSRKRGLWWFWSSSQWKKEKVKRVMNWLFKLRFMVWFEPIFRLLNWEK